MALYRNYRLIFLAGLALKFILIFTISSSSAELWFGPFLKLALSDFSLDPWAKWISSNGSYLAFPYGYSMLASFIPLGIVFNYFTIETLLTYKISILIFDFLLLLTFIKLFPGRDRVIFLGYWLSPIIIFASYIHGANDLIPIFFLTTSFLYLKESKFLKSALLLSLAISAKISMLLALPFCLIYIAHKKLEIKNIYLYISVLCTSLLILFSPMFFSKEFYSMIFLNPEIGKLYNFSFTFPNGSSLLLTPIFIVLSLFSIWSVKKINFDIFYILTGLSFLGLVLLSAPSLGWFMWVIPLLIMFQNKEIKYSYFLTLVFSLLFVLNYSVLMPVKTSWGSVYSFNFIGVDFGRFASLTFTCFISFGLILFFKIAKELIIHNDYFKLGKNPFSIGIAGDSGVGKDSLSDSIIKIFGENNVCRISGDDYHFWDRKKSIWNYFTHLNPIANDLESFYKNLTALKAGNSIISRSYNHDNGIRGSLIETDSNLFLLASGLHAFYNSPLRECYDIKIFMHMDENLRFHFKKLRDSNKRGYSSNDITKAFKKRIIDSEKFVQPQMQHADLVFYVEPSKKSKNFSLDIRSPLKLKLTVTTKDENIASSLIKVLTGICELDVSTRHLPVAHGTEILIQGEVSSENLNLASKILCPRVLKLIDIHPIWEKGVLGLMQLIVLANVNQALYKRDIR
jgi:uridine kinase